MRTVLKYISEVRSELKQVIWPSRNEVTKLTSTVILISIIVGAYLVTLDLGFTKLIEKIIEG